MLIVGGIFLLLFGGRIPTVMRSLGQSVTSFKSGLEDEDEKMEDESGNSKKK
jgi:sec-independent protein translocase protein TatA